MTDDQLERDLTTLFRERTASTTYPPVPPALRDLAGAPRRRRPWLAASVAAAAVVLVVAGTGLGAALLERGADKPAPVGPGVDPAAPGIPYVHDGVLHVGATQLPTTADQLRTAGDTVLLTDVSSDDAGREVSTSWVLRDGVLVPLPYLDDAEPALSTDGSQVVGLSHPDPSTTRLRVHDLPDGGVVGTLDLPVAGECCWSGGIGLVGLDDRGRVFYDEAARAMAWDVDDDSRVAIGDATVDVRQVVSQGVLITRRSRGSENGGALGRVGESGRFFGTRGYVLADGTEPVVWSPQGDAAAYSSGSGPVIDRTDGSVLATRLDLEGRVYRSVAALESAEAALIIASRGSAYELLRCGTDGDCEVVAEMGGVDQLSDWAFPMP